MMTRYIYKTLIFHSLKNPTRLCRPPLSSSSIFFFTSSRPEKSDPVLSIVDYLVNRHNFSPEAASKASSAATRFKNPEYSDSIILHLKESGFSQTHLEQVIKTVPRVLSSNLETTIKPKIAIFRDLGISSSDIADIISCDPWILTRSVDNTLGPSLLALKTVLGSTEGVAKVLKVSGWFLKGDLEKTLLPNLGFMKSCGISNTQIIRYMYSFPRFFLLKPENLRGLAKRVDEMGFDRMSKMYLSAMRVLSSMSTESWKFKLQLFRDLGFSEDDILLVFRRIPQVFAVSENKIKEITQFLLCKGFDISLVYKHPEILLCSLEKRLKPRFWVIINLERNNLLQKKPGWMTVFKISNEKFNEKFVIPYSDGFSETCNTSDG